MYRVRDGVDWDITDISILSSAITISTHQELISSSIIAPKWASWLQSFCMGVKVSVNTDSAWDCLLLEDQCLLQLIFCLILQLIFLFAAVPFLYTLMIWIHQVLLRLLDDCRYLFIPEVPNDFRIDLVFGLCCRLTAAWDVKFTSTWDLCFYLLSPGTFLRLNR